MWWKRQQTAICRFHALTHFGVSSVTVITLGKTWVPSMQQRWTTSSGTSRRRARTCAASLQSPCRVVGARSFTLRDIYSEYMSKSSVCVCVCVCECVCGRHCLVFCLCIITIFPSIECESRVHFSSLPLFHQLNVKSRVQFSSAQDGVNVLGNAHESSFRSVRSLADIAFETLKQAYDKKHPIRITLRHRCRHKQLSKCSVLNIHQSFLWYTVAADAEIKVQFWEPRGMECFLFSILEVRI